MPREILFLDSKPSVHHNRFFELFSMLGNVHSVYVDLTSEIPDLEFSLIVFADLDVTIKYAEKFEGPTVGISWAWDLQQTMRQGSDVTERLRLAMNVADLLLVDSIKVEAIARDFGILQEKISRAPYGIDIDQFPLRKPKIGKPSKLRLYTNRRWEELYRPELLLEMANELTKLGESFELKLANDGSLREFLLDKHSTLFTNGSCIWLGNVTQSQNIVELLEADLYISVAKSDGSSLSLLECMATGTPSLVTDIPENRYWIEDDHPEYLFSGNSGLELAERIQNLTMNPYFFRDSNLCSRDKITREANWSETRKSILSRVNALFHT